MSAAIEVRTALSGTAQLAAGPEAVRAVLRDPDGLAQALPHVDPADPLVREDGSFRAVIRPALALGEIPVHTVWWPQPSASADAVAYRVEGRTDEHRLAFDIQLTLAPDAGGTRARWEVGLYATGTIRSAGQRVLLAIVRAQIALVLGAVDRVALDRDPVRP